MLKIQERVSWEQVNNVKRFKYDSAHNCYIWKPVLDHPLWAQSHICILYQDEGGAFISVTKQCLQSPRKMNIYNKFKIFLPATDSYLEAVGDPYLSHHSYVEHAVAREISPKTAHFSSSLILLKELWGKVLPLPGGHS